MDIKESSVHETGSPESAEGKEKLKGLAEKLRSEGTETKSPKTLKEVQDTLESLVAGRAKADEVKSPDGMEAESKLNNPEPVEYGLTACESFCKKLRDGTRVHGTSH